MNRRKHNPAALDSDAQRVLQALAWTNSPSVHEMAPEEVRAAFAEQTKKMAPRPPPVEGIEDLVLDGCNIPARLYRPKARFDKLPTVIFFHGGGWVSGSLDTYDPVCQLLANSGGFAVLAIDYRKGPEHKFPAAVEDARAALIWMMAHGTEFGLDEREIAVAGDSSGGNLAAVAALIARDEGPDLRTQALVYPPTDALRDTRSYREFAEGYSLTAAAVEWYYHQYLRDERDRLDWRCSPIRAESLAGLPPAFIAAAGYDPLRDEVALYADRLTSAGVPVDFRLYAGQMHGFMHMGGIIKEGRELIQAMADYLAGQLFAEGANQERRSSAKAAL
jgi:acetyl esterase